MIAATTGAAVATATAVSPAAVLVGVEPGQWVFRDRADNAVQRICIKDGASLIQLRHPGQACNRLVLERTPAAVTVQYTCRGRGFGRTHVRRETARLIQLESQGIADGLPFEIEAEGRWVGSCG